MPFLSYAQNFEDAMLNRVFERQAVGFYIDIGANHPSNGSVTRAFYDRGWSGINIEPGSIYEALAAARPRDTNLRLAVLDYQGQTTFSEIESDLGMSHVGEGAGTVTTVDCDTLENIIRNHAHGRAIDFLKIDAEGSELAIIRSTDWSRIRPRVLLVNATRPWSNILNNGLWEPLILDGGYVRAYFDGINCFYVPKENLAAVEVHFRIPINVIDGQKIDDLALAFIREREVAVEDTARVNVDLAEIQLQVSQLLTERGEWTARHNALQQALEASAKELESACEDRSALTEQVISLRNEVELLTSERDRVVAAYEKMCERCDLLGEQNIAYAAEKANKPLSGTSSTSLPETIDQLQVADVLMVLRPMDALLQSINHQAVVWLPAVMEEIRRSVQDNANNVSMQHLAAEMERALITLTLESSYHRSENEILSNR